MEPNAIPVVNEEENLNSKLNKLSLASRSSSVPVKVITCSHIWTIHNFRQCFEEKVSSLISAPFLTDIDDNLQWRMELEFSQDRSYFNLHIYLIAINGDINSCASSSKRALCYGPTQIIFSILNRNNKETNTKEKTDRFGFNVSNTLTFERFISKSILLANSSELLPDDKLTIYCEVKVRDIFAPGESLQIALPKCQMMDDFKFLLENKKFRDVTIYARQAKLPAHKAILAARSHVFRAMFETDTKENTNNRVLFIRNINDEVMKEMLRFIYTGEVLNLKTVARDLMIAADKYQLERLKVLCEQELCLNLSKENVVEMVILADLHNLDHLKDRAIKLISISPAEVMKTPRWKTMMAKHPYLRDVLQRLVANSSSK